MAKRKKRLSPDERARMKRLHQFRTDIRTVITNCGFNYVPTRDVTFVLDDQPGEIDGLYVHENIILIVEDVTRGDEKKIKEHLLKKANVVRRIVAHEKEFLNLLPATYPRFNDVWDSSYDGGQVHLRFLYFTLNPIDRNHLKQYPEILVIDHPLLLYFKHLSQTIKKSTRYELFKFLKLELDVIGHQESGTDKKDYEGILLPESPSGYPPGHKIVSFLIRPDRLLEQGYVLRRESWRGNRFLYQRILVPHKIEDMRRYLAEEKRVFVNNLIVSLPSDTDIRGLDGKALSPMASKQMGKVKIEIPRRLNSIGIIDGQHRVFCYHEGSDRHDGEIEKLRRKQHLLLTGIVYPDGYGEDDQMKFEAMLFFEINNKQKKVAPALRQEIELIIDPFSTTAIAKKVVDILAIQGPLAGLLERHVFDVGPKIKTSSIVSYGMKHIVKLSGDDSLFSLWNDPKKSDLPAKQDLTLLNEYTKYCAKEIAMMISGFKENAPQNLWTFDKKVSRILTTTTVNALISCLRKLIEEKKSGDFLYYRKRFAKLNFSVFESRNFTFTSSHWKDLGELMYSQCFQ